MTHCRMSSNSISFSTFCDREPYQRDGSLLHVVYQRDGSLLHNDCFEDWIKHDIDPHAYVSKLIFGLMARIYLESFLVLKCSADRFKMRPAQPSGSAKLFKP